MDETTSVAASDTANVIRMREREKGGKRCLCQGKCVFVCVCVCAQKQLKVTITNCQSAPIVSSDQDDGGDGDGDGDGVCAGQTKPEDCGCRGEGK